MILNCPDCKTRFAIDAANLEPDGRRVKCGKCAHVWFESPPDPDEGEPEPITVTPLDPDIDPAVSPRNLPALRNARGGGGARLAWIISAVLLVAIVAVLWFGRAPISTAFPQAEALYATVGIDAFPPPGEGLEVEFSVSAENGQLALSGEVINISDRAREVPRLHVVISDESKNILKTWSFETGAPPLGPGERATFSSQTDEIPERAANVSILFTSPDENP